MLDIDIGAWVGFLKILDGLVGIDNLINMDADLAVEKLKESIIDPLGNGGLVDDVIDGGKATMAIKGVNWMQKQLTGKNIGITIGRVRIHA